MFSKLKQFKELRDQAKSIQSVLNEEKITIDKNGVKVTVNGNMEIMDLQISDTVNRDNLANSLKVNINSAIKDVQKVVAGKMKNMGDISSMLKY